MKKPKIKLEIVQKYKDLIKLRHEIEVYTNRTAWLKFDINGTWRVMERVHDLSGTDYYYHREIIHENCVKEIVENNILPLWFDSEKYYERLK